MSMLTSVDNSFCTDEHTHARVCTHIHNYVKVLNPHAPSNHKPQLSTMLPYENEK